MSQVNLLWYFWCLGFLCLLYSGFCQSIIRRSRQDFNAIHNYNLGDTKVSQKQNAAPILHTRDGYSNKKYILNKFSKLNWVMEQIRKCSKLHNIKFLRKSDDIGDNYDTIRFKIVDIPYGYSQEYFPEAMRRKIVDTTEDVFPAVSKDRTKTFNRHQTADAPRSYPHQMASLRPYFQPPLFPNIRIPVFKPIPGPVPYLHPGPRRPWAYPTPWRLARPGIYPVPYPLREHLPGHTMNYPPAMQLYHMYKGHGSKIAPLHDNSIEEGKNNTLGVDGITKTTQTISNVTPNSGFVPMTTTENYQTAIYSETKPSKDSGKSKNSNSVKSDNKQIDSMDDVEYSSYKMSLATQKPEEATVTEIQKIPPVSDWEVFPLVKNVSVKDAMQGRFQYMRKVDWTPLTEQMEEATAFKDKAVHAKQPSAVVYNKSLALDPPQTSSATEEPPIVTAEYPMEILNHYNFTSANYLKWKPMVITKLNMDKLGVGESTKVYFGLGRSMDKSDDLDNRSMRSQSFSSSVKGSIMVEE